ncbi:MAG: bleomycin resistance family protein [Burkholderiales bacterium]
MAILVAAIGNGALREGVLVPRLGNESQADPSRPEVQSAVARSESGFVMTLTLLLHSRNLEETREFYGSMLGFNVRDSAGDTLTVERGGGRLIFTTGNLWSDAGFAGTIYFTVPDVDGYFASIRDKVDVAWPLQDMSYGSREFGIRDCNGYYLAFQQRI